ncbi:MAG: 4Fe-4S dicluster domain-containing protein [Bdellovibrionales bacterium]|nr:4Fe-4S dicluster domain-containing protein [Bdellovibrionales bacterium]
MSETQPIATKKRRRKKGEPPSFPIVSARELKKLSLFEELTSVEISLLEGHVRRASAQPGETIIELIQSEDPFSYFLFIAVGQVYIKGLDEQARLRPLNFLRKGDFFVDKSFVWNNQVATLAASITEAELLLIPKEKLKEIVDKNPTLQQKIKEVTERVDYRNRIYNEDNHAQSVLEFLIDTGLTQASRIKITLLDKCIACDTCYDSCEERHGFQRLSRGYAKFGVLDFAKSCLTCFYPTCIPACPVDSVVYDPVKDEVEILDSCIGCTSCAQACQYGAITMHKLVEDDQRFARFITPDKKRPPKLIADKCNHCEGYTDMACISNCPTDAIIEVNSQELLENPRIFGLGDGAHDPQKILTKEEGTDTTLQAFYVMAALISTIYLLWETLALLYAPALSSLYNLQQLGLIDPVFRLAIQKGSDLCVFLGNIGFILIMVAMLYPVRKALPQFFKYLGKKPRWLDLHNFCGFMGCVFITFHTGFEFNLQGSTIGYFALVAVMLSGFLGRFLYQMIPRGVAGTELQMRDIENEDSVLTMRMEALFSHSTSLREQVDETVKKIIGDAQRPSFKNMVRSFIVTKFMIRRLTRAIEKSEKVPDSDLDQLESVLHEKVKLKRNVAYLHVSASLFKKWQWIHRPFAYVMGTLAIFHIFYNVLYFPWT